MIDRAHPKPTLIVKRICETSVRTLPVTSAAASVMTADGHRGVIHASDATARSLENIQFTVGEGSRLRVLRSRSPGSLPDLARPEIAGEQTWSAFRDCARELGIRSVFSFPLHLGAASLGVLTTYHVQPGDLRGDDLARAVRLADAAAFAILDVIVANRTEPTVYREPVDHDLEFY